MNSLMRRSEKLFPVLTLLLCEKVHQGKYFMKYSFIGQGKVNFLPAHKVKNFLPVMRGNYRQFFQLLFNQQTSPDARYA